MKRYALPSRLNANSSVCSGTPPLASSFDDSYSSAVLAVDRRRLFSLPIARYFAVEAPSSHVADRRPGGHGGHEQVEVRVEACGRRRVGDRERDLRRSSSTGRARATMAGPRAPRRAVGIVRLPQRPARRQRSETPCEHGDRPRSEQAARCAPGAPIGLVRPSARRSARPGPACRPGACPRARAAPRRGRGSRRRRSARGSGAPSRARRRSRTGSRCGTAAAASSPTRRGLIGARWTRAGLEVVGGVELDLAEQVAPVGGERRERGVPRLGQSAVGGRLRATAAGRLLVPTIRSSRPWMPLGVEALRARAAAPRGLGPPPPPRDAQRERARSRLGAAGAARAARPRASALGRVLEREPEPRVDPAGRAARASSVLPVARRVPWPQNVHSGGWRRSRRSARCPRTGSATSCARCC